MFLFILPVLLLITALDARHNNSKRSAVAIGICDDYYEPNATVRCACLHDAKRKQIVESADCFITDPSLTHDDKRWAAFESLKTADKVIFTTKNVKMKYIPTNAIKFMESAVKIGLQYGNIDEVKSYAFANLSNVEEIILSGNQIEKLNTNAFAHHSALKTMNLDDNRITEINRDVFVDLPSLTKLFLASNQITTIHDKAFIHLKDLKELVLGSNKIFSLNSESFVGLKKLNKLDLTRNSLEVVGDNTFSTLSNLHYLSLQYNQIQLIDDNAFKGLKNLMYLNLNFNKIAKLDNAKVFEHLQALTSLNMKNNSLRDLKQEVIEPILKNLYSEHAVLDVDENNFACDCKLEWFAALKTITSSRLFINSLDNLKCDPSPEVNEMWKKSLEAEKNQGLAFEEAAPNTDYEYYDESQLEGKLFYMDLRTMLNCSGKEIATPVVVTEKSTTIPSTSPLANSASTTLSSTAIPIETLNDEESKAAKSRTTKKYVPTKITSRGTLDLSSEGTTENLQSSTAKNLVADNLQETKSDFTTTRLATVSAKPVQENENHLEHRSAASAKFNSRNEDFETNAMPHKDSASRSSQSIIIPVIIAFILSI